MAGNIGNALTDYLRKGRILSDQPGYLCTHCGAAIRNYDLKPTLDAISPVPVQPVWGHVTCPCIMREVGDAPGKQRQATQSQQQARPEPPRQEPRQYAQTNFTMRDMPF